MNKILSKLLTPKKLNYRMTVTETQFLTTEQLAERYGLVPIPSKAGEPETMALSIMNRLFATTSEGQHSIRYQFQSPAWEEANAITPIKPLIMANTPAFQSDLLQQQHQRKRSRPKHSY